MASILKLALLNLLIVEAQCRHATDLTLLIQS